MYTIHLGGVHSPSAFKSILRVWSFGLKIMIKCLHEIATHFTMAQDRRDSLEFIHEIWLRRGILIIIKLSFNWTVIMCSTAGIQTRESDKSFSFKNITQLRESLVTRCLKSGLKVICWGIRMLSRWDLEHCKHLQKFMIESGQSDEILIDCFNKVWKWSNISKAKQ
jgi:hypothetical protein